MSCHESREKTPEDDNADLPKRACLRSRSKLREAKLAALKKTLEIENSYQNKKRKKNVKKRSRAKLVEIDDISSDNSEDIERKIFDYFSSTSYEDEDKPKDDKPKKFYIKLPTINKKRILKWRNQLELLQKQEEESLKSKKVLTGTKRTKRRIERKTVEKDQKESVDNVSNDDPSKKYNTRLSSLSVEGSIYDNKKCVEPSNSENFAKECPIDNDTKNSQGSIIKTSSSGKDTLQLSDSTTMIVDKKVTDLGELKSMEPKLGIAELYKEHETSDDDTEISQDLFFFEERICQYLRDDYEIEDSE